MKLQINGEEREFPAILSLLDMLAQLGIDGRKVAVERNREIVPKSQYAETVLADGDQLEVVHFIGGGAL